MISACRSAEWGTQPLYWYFTSALPRAMLGALPLTLYGLYRERRVWDLVAPTTVYVAIYSLLPHKEVRFS